MPKERKKSVSSHSKSISISLDGNTLERLEWMLANLQFKPPNKNAYRRVNRSEFIKSLINDYYNYIHGEIKSTLDQQDLDL